MSENGRISRVLGNIGHGGHALADDVEGAEKLVADREDLNTLSAVALSAPAGKVATTSFGYLFPRLAAGFPDHHLPQGDRVGVVVRALDALGEAMVEQPVAGVPAGSPIPPVYTYWGQFVDHDLVLATDGDTRISITGDVLDPEPPTAVVAALANTRTPALNLDSVYGEGPFDASRKVPYDGIKLALGELTPVAVGEPVPPADDAARDLPRDADRVARIGDGRNDENLFVAQLHVAFLRFHNAAVDWVRAGEPERVTDVEVFLRARELTRWTYQWLVVHDYLRTVARPDVVDEVETDDANLLDATDERPVVFMPVEFAAAGFRFGHSMVRAGYDWNRNFGRPGSAGATFVQLFQFTGGSQDPIGGLDLPTLPANWPVEWDRMVDKDSPFPDRFARRIDTRIAPPLTDMINQGTDPALPERVRGLLKHLARRNLLRGYRLAVPCAQAVAQELGVPVLTREELERGLPDHARTLAGEAGLLERTPLWFYVLKEAEVQEDGARLGRVGSRVVAETIIGQIRRDPGSYLHRTSWSPAQGVRLPDGGEIRTIAAFLRFAGVL
ncbi:hypothetical protein BJF78_32625 [Pseudonocardia sp. CNS-139]|nr:hypothetical protein BJF78_32625 [Pseudonocardia sp. CNS-139]